MKPISSLLDGLDYVVEPFAQAIGEPELEEILDAEAPTVEHLHIIENFRDTAFASTSFPVP